MERELIPDEVKKVIKDTFLAELKNDVHVEVFTKEGVNDKFNEAAVYLMNVFSELSDHLKVSSHTVGDEQSKKRDVQRSPVVLIEPDKYRIRYTGAPLGEERQHPAVRRQAVDDQVDALRQDVVMVRRLTRLLVVVVDIGSRCIDQDAGADGEGFGVRFRRIPDFTNGLDVGVHLSDELKARLHRKHRTNADEVGRVVAEMLAETCNCRTLLETTFTQVETDGPRIKCIRAEARDGRTFRIHARVFIDATGGVYLCRAAGYETMLGPESKDGIYWTKPNLGLYEFEGSTANNIVFQRGEGEMAPQYVLPLEKRHLDKMASSGLITCVTNWLRSRLPSR